MWRTAKSLISIAATTFRSRVAQVAAPAAVAISSAIALPALAADVIFVGPTNGTWNLDANWQGVGPDTTFGNGDDTFVQPTTADAAIIWDGSTVDLTSTETILEMQVSTPAHPGDTSVAHGVARLNIGPGAVLTTNGNSSGIRLGRVLDAGQAIGTSRGEIVQTGGSVVIQQGANGLRMSASDSGNVADSLYRISGGSIRGGAGADDTMVSDLRVGTITNVWNEAEFHVVGSSATSIRFLDIQAAANSAENGDSIFHFSIDAGGVTPIVAEDELQWRGDATNGLGNNFLNIDLIGEAPSSDIVLFRADRLNTNGVPSGAANEHFTNLLEGDSVIRTWGLHTYTWTLDYTDGSDDGMLHDSVALRFVSKVAVPEPASAVLVVLGVLALTCRRSTQRG
jgi:hypothetical protein